MAASASLPFGMTVTVSSAVRTRVERIPTCSTVPRTASATIQSPRVNGRSIARIPAPNTLTSVSFEASAKARPLIPSPAMMPLGSCDGPHLLGPSQEWDGQLKQQCCHHDPERPNEMPRDPVVLGFMQSDQLHDRSREEYGHRQAEPGK